MQRRESTFFGIPQCTRKTRAEFQKSDERRERSFARKRTEVEAPGIEACAGGVKTNHSSAVQEESGEDDPPLKPAESVGSPPAVPRVKICDSNEVGAAEELASSCESERQLLSRQLREAHDLIAQLQRELERARAVIDQQRDVVSRATRQHQHAATRQS